MFVEQLCLEILNRDTGGCCTTAPSCTYKVKRYFYAWLQSKEETLRVVTIAMIYFTLLHTENFNVSGGLHMTQLNVYDGAFIAEIVNR